MRRRTALTGIGGAMAFFTERLPYLPEAEKARAVKALQFLQKERADKPPEVAEEFRNPEAAARALKKLHAFVVMAWKLVEPATDFVDNWHIRELCSVLEGVYRGEIKRLLINVPPGSMKSLLVEVFWPAWVWAHDPRKRWLTVSHSADLTIRDNVRLREIITSPWYEEYFWTPALARSMKVGKVRLKGDQNEKVRFDTTCQGWRIATGVGGRGIGEHPDIKVVDDPITPDQARSEADRGRVWSYLKQTLSSRGVARDAAIVVIMQRLHEEDPSGRILAQGGYDRIMWPMRFEKERADPRDQRTRDNADEGTLLWPKLFDEAKVRQLEIDLDPYGAAGQLQQRPAPEGGGLFKREWFEIVDTAPPRATRCRGWDTASTEGGGDYTAGVKIARAPDGTFYVEDVLRGQWGPSDVEGIIMQAASIDGAGCRIREEQEPGSAGKQVCAARAKKLVGFDYKGVPITGDKPVRARPYRAQCEARNVKLVRGPWNAAYLDELAVVFAGAHDDQADASAVSFNELATVSAVRTRKIHWG